MKRFQSLLSLLLIVGLIYYSFYSLMPQSGEPATIPDTEFSSERALIPLKEITKAPHFIGTQEHERVREYIVQQLQDLMDDKTSIFSGRSGVGKSSIANIILPDLDIAVGVISNAGEGKHTTTTATLHKLPSGGYLIDSPGVRDYALGDISLEDLSGGYIEFAPYKDQCRFNNCTHDHEPKCAVRVAVENKEISNERYQRYLHALRSLD